MGDTGRMKSVAKIMGGILAMVMMLQGYAAAEYRSNSDTGTEILDYIENRHRAERENRLSDEQIQLIHDAQSMESRLRKPLDPK